MFPLTILRVAVYGTVVPYTCPTNCTNFCICDSSRTTNKNRYRYYRTKIDRTCPEYISSFDDSGVGTNFDDLQAKLFAKYLTDYRDLIVPDQRHLFHYNFQLT